jgi:hypothetical protein
MTKELYNTSIETQELQLLGSVQKLTHYGVVGFLLIIPVAKVPEAFL